MYKLSHGATIAFRNFRASLEHRATNLYPYQHGHISTLACRTRLYSHWAGSDAAKSSRWSRFIDSTPDLDQLCRSTSSIWKLSSPDRRNSGGSWYPLGGWGCGSISAKGQGRVERQSGSGRVRRLIIAITFLIIRTPQAYPAMSSSNLSTLSTQLANAISEHFMPSVPAIPILAPTK